MSERELGHIEALSCLVEGRMSVAHAAEGLGLSLRQVQRLASDLPGRGCAGAMPQCAAG